MKVHMMQLLNKPVAVQYGQPMFLYTLKYSQKTTVFACRTKNIGQKTTVLARRTTTETNYVKLWIAAELNYVTKC